MRGNVFAVTALLFVALGVGGVLPAEAKEKPVVVGKGAVPVGLIRPSTSVTAVEGATYVGSQKWVHFFGPVNGKTKVDSFIGYAAHLGLIRGGTPSGLYC